MTDLSKNRDEIITEIFEKARANGFVIPNEIRGVSVELVWPYIVFSHSFAKAFWGEEEIEHVADGVSTGKTYPKWKLELSTMVLDADPISYLEKSLK